MQLPQGHGDHQVSAYEDSPRHRRFPKSTDLTVAMAFRTVRANAQGVGGPALHPCGQTYRRTW